MGRGGVGRVVDLAAAELGFRRAARFMGENPSNRIEMLVADERSEKENQGDPLEDTHRSPEPVSMSRLTVWPGVPIWTGTSHSRSLASTKPLRLFPAILHQLAYQDDVRLPQARLTRGRRQKLDSDVGVDEVRELGKSLQSGSSSIGLKFGVGNSAQGECTIVGATHQRGEATDGGEQNGDAGPERRHVRYS